MQSVSPLRIYHRTVCLHVSVVGEKAVFRRPHRTRWLPITLTAYRRGTCWSTPPRPLYRVPTHRRAWRVRTGLLPRRTLYVREEKNAPHAPRGDIIVVRISSHHCRFIRCFLVFYSPAAPKVKRISPRDVAIIVRFHVRKGYPSITAGFRVLLRVRTRSYSGTRTVSFMGFWSFPLPLPPRSSRRHESNVTRLPRST